MRWPAANMCLTILFLPAAVYQVRHRESAWPHESFASLCQEPQRSQCQSLCHGSPGSPAPTRPRPYHGCGPGGGAGGGYPSDDPCSCRGPTVWAPATPANGAVIRAATAVAANRRQNIVRFIVMLYTASAVPTPYLAMLNSPASIRDPHFGCAPLLRGAGLTCTKQICGAYRELLPGNPQSLTPFAFGSGQSDLEGLRCDVVQLPGDLAHASVVFVPAVSRWHQAEQPSGGQVR
jgi:hypothetical protein